MGKGQAALGEERRAHLAVGEPAVLERVLVHEVSRLLQGIAGQKWGWVRRRWRVGRASQFGSWWRPPPLLAPICRGGGDQQSRHRSGPPRLQPCRSVARESGSERTSLRDPTPRTSALASTLYQHHPTRRRASPPQEPAASGHGFQHHRPCRTGMALGPGCGRGGTRSEHGAVRGPEGDAAGAVPGSRR